MVCNRYYEKYLNNIHKERYELGYELKCKLEKIIDVKL